jgi:hypothetical protein
MMWGSKSSSLGLTVFLAACYAPPASSERFEESVVITAHDQQTDFKNFRTFFLRPEIRSISEPIVGVLPEDELVPEAIATPLLQATEQNLLDRGYVASATQEGADLAVELIYMRAIYSSTYCYDWWYWWDYYYWGYYYYYPSYVSCDTASWRSGMMVTNVTDVLDDPTLPPGEISPPPEVMPPDVVNPPLPPAVGELRRGVWMSGIYGVELDSVSYVTQRTVAGIDQSFVQSPYFTTFTAEPK